MTVERIQLKKNRELVIHSMAPSAALAMTSPFATFLPAYNARERKQAVAMAADLIRGGCIEFCCVGPESEQLHDELDDVIVEHGTLDVVTTWDEEAHEAVVYFLLAATAGRCNLLALIQSHPELEALLRQVRE